MKDIDFSNIDYSPYKKEIKIIKKYVRKIKLSPILMFKLWLYKRKQKRLR
jgi:hypothetical protein